MTIIERIVGLIGLGKFYAFLNHLLYIIEHPWDYFDKILNKIVNLTFSL